MQTLIRDARGLTIPIPSAIEQALAFTRFLFDGFVAARSAEPLRDLIKDDQISGCQRGLRAFISLREKAFIVFAALTAHGVDPVHWKVHHEFSHNPAQR